MSEKENQVFKNQSTNKKFPPLNTPSSPYGGLEGCGNFSSESIKNQSGKNKDKNKIQNKSKAKTLKRKKQNTKRSASSYKKRSEPFRNINTFGLLSTKQIENHIFNNIDKSTVLRRLRILKKRGYLLASNGLPKGGLAWTLTKKRLKSEKKNLVNSKGLKD